MSIDAHPPTEPEKTTFAQLSYTDGMWFLAICQQCRPIGPMPFRDEKEMIIWADAHEANTGHEVLQMIHTPWGHYSKTVILG